MSYSRPRMADVPLTFWRFLSPVAPIGNVRSCLFHFFPIFCVSILFARICPLLSCELLFTSADCICLIQIPDHSVLFSFLSLFSSHLFHPVFNALLRSGHATFSAYLLSGEQGAKENQILTRMITRRLRSRRRDSKEVRSRRGGDSWIEGPARQTRARRCSMGYCHLGYQTPRPRMDRRHVTRPTEKPRYSRGRPPGKA